ncbi:type II toxin-antitoxin system HigB family toxin [Pectobacterium punjabense]|uniref:type II toxin-antitoxin system HigB family toxin n=1 Tax=Pectobacterium punjabense TaxID=2108399 RepID=UPI003B96874D
MVTQCGEERQCKVFPRTPFDTAIAQLLNPATALADLYRVIYATPDDMKKRFPSLDRIKFREKWWVIDIGGGHLRVMFFADFEREKIFIKHITTHAEYDRLIEYYRRNKE